MNKIIKISDNEKTTTFIEPCGKNKYIAFGVTHGRRPKIIGLTIPSSLEQLKFYFDIDIPKELKT